MEINYSNRVVGFDFETSTEHFAISGKCRKDDESGEIKEFSASLRRLSEPYEGAPLSVSFNGEPVFTLHGLTAAETQEVLAAIEEVSDAFSGKEEQ